nr:hypothetical protein [Clostridia bacterium]
MKAKLIIIVIIAILVVLGGTFAGLWFFTDVFNFLKPANDVFSNQIEKALNLEGAKFSNYSDFLKEYKEMSDKSYKSKFNMTADLKISKLNSEIQDTINKSKITIESNADIKGKKAQNKIGLYSDNSEILSLDLITNDTKLGIGSKDLYDKYLSISLEDLTKFIEKNSSEFDEEELEMILNSFSNSNINIYDLLYISDEDLKHFDETYRDCFTKLISKDCFTTEKKIEVDVNDDTVKTTAYYLTLTGEDTYNFVSELTNLIKDDSVLTKIITEKANLLLESASEEKLSEDDVKDLVSKTLDELLKELEEIKDKKDTAIQIAVYSNNSKPVRIDLNNIKDANDLDEKETIFSIEYAKSKNIYTIYQNERAYVTIVDEYTKNSDEEKVGKITAKASGVSVGTLDYEIINKDNENKLDLSLNVPLAQISGKINFSSKGNYKKEPVTIEGLMSFKYKEDSATINFDGSIEYGDVSIPELTSSNSVDFLKLSETEMKDELVKILTKASEVLPSRLKLIGIDVKPEDILPKTINTDNNAVVENLTTNDAA